MRRGPCGAPVTGGKPKTNRYLEALRPTLDACGAPWREEWGIRHSKVYVGDALAVVIPRGSFKERARHVAKCKRDIERAAERWRLKIGACPTGKNP